MSGTQKDDPGLPGLIRLWAGR